MAGDPTPARPHYKYPSWNIYQDPETGEIRKPQRDYLLEVVKAAGELKEQNCHPVTRTHPSSRQRTSALSVQLSKR